jgi:hypothetical protein
MSKRNRSNPAPVDPIVAPVVPVDPPAPVASPTIVVAPAAAPAPSLIGGKPFTLRRAMAVVSLAVVGGDALASFCGSGGWWNVARDLGIVSQKRSLRLARAHLDGIIGRLASIPMTNAHRVAIAAKMGSDMVDARRGAHPSLDVRYVVGGAYWLAAPALLPSWLLDAPIPDALREPGVADRVLRYEAAALVTHGDVA